MTSYRRIFIPGGSYFFTVNLADRRLRLLTGHIESRPLERRVYGKFPLSVGGPAPRGWGGGSNRPSVARPTAL
jgi:hypothetical protein